MLYVRGGARGPWLSCSAFPKCRARGKWSDLGEDVQKKWLAAFAEHEKHHPMVILKDMQGRALTDAKGKPILRKEDDAVGEAGAELAPVEVLEEAEV